MMGQMPPDYLCSDSAAREDEDDPDNRMSQRLQDALVAGDNEFFRDDKDNA
jgi:hypothetical protein